MNPRTKVILAIVTSTQINVMYDLYDPVNGSNNETDLNHFR